ncbi:SUMF1/EgtB/PvdO family nonheme iron enzyme [Caenimonas koreensis]|uniref:SUMF1/EgtB/PvdO family nonheme iron enzyme n=1 Tax=Caenimonas koreensis TaxID=367474 RepID=UPI0037852674
MASLTPESAPASTGAADIRRAGREVLSLAFIDARNHTLGLLARFEQAEAGQKLVVPRLPALELPLWIAGNIAWLGEYWIGRNPNRYQGTSCPPGCVRLASIDPTADQLFDPALVPHAARWSLELPGYDAVRAYLLDTLETTLELLERTPDEDEALHFFRAALFHEDMRCEHLMTIAQAVGLPLQITLPGGLQPREPMLVPAQRWSLGARPGGFVFDVEKWAHSVDVPEFEIDAQPVTWGQYSEFVDDGGYDDPVHWQPEGWQWLQHEAGAEGRRGPRYVEQIGSASGAVLQMKFGKVARMPPSLSAMHVSWWEADAFARWAGRRLPTEVEWELAVHATERRGFRWGDVREWTASTLRPWAGYTPDAWSENTPFESQLLFGRARVQRGASFATRARLKYPKARGFALPERDEGFVGFRTCSL